MLKVGDQINPDDYIALQIRVLLPEGWRRQYDDGPGRVYRASFGQPSGVLRLSACPPMEAEDLEVMERQVQKFHSQSKLVSAYEGDSTLGQLTVAVYQHPQYGLVSVMASLGTT